MSYTTQRTNEVCHVLGIHLRDKDVQLEYTPDGLTVFHAGRAAHFTCAADGKKYLVESGLVHRAESTEVSIGEATMLDKGFGLFSLYVTGRPELSRRNVDTASIRRALADL